MFRWVQLTSFQVWDYPAMRAERYICWDIQSTGFVVLCSGTQYSRMKNPPCCSLSVTPVWRHHGMYQMMIAFYSPYISLLLTGPRIAVSCVVRGSERGGQPDPLQQRPHLRPFPKSNTRKVGPKISLLVAGIFNDIVHQHTAEKVRCLSIVCTCVVLSPLAFSHDVQGRTLMRISGSTDINI